MKEYICNIFTEDIQDDINYNYIEYKDNDMPDIELKNYSNDRYNEKNIIIVLEENHNINNINNKISKIRSRTKGDDGDDGDDWIIL